MNLFLELILILPLSHLVYSSIELSSNKSIRALFVRNRKNFAEEKCYFSGVTTLNFFFKMLFFRFSYRIFIILLLLFMLFWNGSSMTLLESKRIQTVYVVFSNHLDLGFTNDTISVINEYFTKFFPQAVNVSLTMRAQGKRYVYTTKSWLVSLYLNCPSRLFTCPSPSEIQTFIEAIRIGDISWHAFPFNAQAELYDDSLFEFGLHLTHQLDLKFGLPPKTAMSQRDVPGITNSVIPSLQRNNISLISFGVNYASAPADVPDIFEWRKFTSQNQYASVTVLYHPGGYGGLELTDMPFIEGFPATIAVSFKGDNYGPHSISEISAVMTKLETLFPNADIKVSNFEEFAKQLHAAKPKLPVVSKEIGDTWLYGISSDPLKISKFRTMQRERSQCLQSRECSLNDPRIFQFSFYLMKIAEHTWGGDLKLYIDYVHWSRNEFESVFHTNRYQQLQNTWIDQRNYLQYAIDSLEDHPIRRKILVALNRITQPRLPNVNDFRRVSENQVFIVNDYRVRFGSRGELNMLERENRSYCDSSHTIGEFLFQSFDDFDYNRFLGNYSYCYCLGAYIDFGKPFLFIGNPKSFSAHMETVGVWQHQVQREQFLIQSRFPNESIPRLYGAPKSLWTLYRFQGESILISLFLVEKTPSRLPESFWFSFNPIVKQSRLWKIEKLNHLFLNPWDVVKNGSFHQHVTNSVVNEDITIESIDAPMVSPV